MIKKLTFLLLLISSMAKADLKYQPIQFAISTEQESYYEGEKITFNITITNTSTEVSYPVLVPHTHNVGLKLFYLNVFDKANNTTLLRYAEDRKMQMSVQDTGSVEIRYLKPLEQIVIPLYLNDLEHEFLTQNASHHSLGVPMFAGIYKVRLTYNPFQIPLADSLYTFYDWFQEDQDVQRANRLEMPTTGIVSEPTVLKIKRSASPTVSIEGKTYYIKSDGHRYFYLSEDLPQITTDIRCHHITDLPPDSCSIVNEYFYSHFTDLYAEVISRFPDHDIREYRKYLDSCPDYLYTEAYDSLKRQTLYALQLPDKRFYRVSYHPHSGKIQQESYCSPNGTLCDVTFYIYNKNDEFIKKEVAQTEPCLEIELDGKKRSVKQTYLFEDESK